MRQILRIGLGAAVAAFVVTGCGDEGPTEVGSGLLGEGLRTVEVLLDAPAFLERDTTYDQIGVLAVAPFGVVANDFEGELDAHVLIQIQRPFLATYSDADGNPVTDTISHFNGGTLRLVVDTRFEPEAPIDVEVLEVTESWDPNTATWVNRVDSLGSSPVPWTDPGATTGSVMATATWTEGDTLEIPIDSAAAAVWYDTAGARKGGVVRMTTVGKRFRISSASFRYNAVTMNTDTTVEAGGLPRLATLASPDVAPADGSLRVGGRPAWRSLLRFQPLDDLMVPCETGSTSCQIPLSEVTVNTANLVLRTQPVGGRRPEGAMQLEGRAVLEGPGIPVTRSPMSRAFGLAVGNLAVTDFADPASVVARVPVTGFVQRNSSLGADQDPLLWLALVAVSEKALFGYGQFGGVESATPPQLELVVTIPVRKVTP